MSYWNDRIGKARAPMHGIGPSPALAVMLCAQLLTPSAPLRRPAGRAAVRPAQPALLLDVRGEVELRRAGEAAKKPASYFSLRPGDVVAVPAGASAVVRLTATNERLLLGGGSTVRMEADRLVVGSGPTPRSLKPLPRPKPPPPPTGRLEGVLFRSDDDPELGPYRPTPNGSVRQGPVVLRWSGAIEGTNQVLRLEGGAKGSRSFTKTLPRAARRFPLPVGTLIPGKQYRLWTVTAYDSGGNAGRSCEALVRLLTGEERSALSALEKEVKADSGADPGDLSPLLLLARSYEELGLLAEAKAKYAVILKLRPEDEGVREALQRLQVGPKKIP